MTYNTLGRGLFPGAIQIYYSSAPLRLLYGYSTRPRTVKLQGYGFHLLPSLSFYYIRTNYIKAYEVLRGSSKSPWPRMHLYSLFLLFPCVPV
jgi:hypothetical protein